MKPRGRQGPLVESHHLLTVTGVIERPDILTLIYIPALSRKTVKHRQKAPKVAHFGASWNTVSQGGGWAEGHVTLTEFLHFGYRIRRH